MNTKKIRKELGLTQKAFSCALNVHINTVKAWESGRQKPNTEAERKIRLLKADRKPQMVALEEPERETYEEKANTLLESGYVLEWCNVCTEKWRAIFVKSR